MHELIESRWSPRGYDDTATVSASEITEILDAGRWAPTWGRIQPLRFVVGLRGDDTFTRLTGTLNRGNIGWAPRASAFILLCTTNDPDDAKAHTYGAVDLGLALSQMLVQARALGLHGHPMAGFDAAAASERFDIPHDKRPLVVLAVGRLADDPDTLPPEIRERDAWPRERLPLSEVAFGTTWGEPFDS
ncbi:MULTISPECIES: nitroreductase family protein [unclassified Gordonia (in: high G+C Gram-positive bacteria)]|uniref:nitroreductase family protein n=1 Tax=unclassified Gordonia (in: high G+C Gram-positive bacteria) TaxID=2657482 RepID=UPI001F0FFF77|nr:nitroreductase family protein [Gordonia sp. ABSL49_1]MCH5641758.1 nitroreductase family protein [Gordonia sp. ABSL49_1]